ncbi:sigma-54 dependent transcriptional regulator [Geobacter sp. SVR]|uniref:sigma-54-dependent transcriptional regulator n=1 Tax=Geobacter sp. SVR TaxID=2495594 RepID=UPI00143EFF6E|nr:sigma-54 dependent transcriptional regulator [Geobacter sp. SVR]BCS53477.1 acetoacetate metabolism regulatory protein AtoC [Geobacter sp. SVR]GCF85396.1 acetoacetate metabolism regulatory protein AtoC [Geobacter sp. SVR]
MTASGKHILIIDDEENLRHMLSAMLSRQGYLTDTAANGAEGLQRLRDKIYDFVLCDIRMPEMGGKAFLAAALENRVASPVIMMSAYGTVDTAVECLTLGAYDFISKPFKKDEIEMVLKKAEERERLREENSRLRAVVAGTNGFSGIISRNSAMTDLFSQIRKVADLKTPVLVLGESGTGKELIARAIHDASRRFAGPFVAVNCGAIPENLLESELFGHRRGAFTDASSDKTGLFDQADGGTLFLDEVGEMPPALQVKLLRVLQEEEIRPLGASASHTVDVRVVSATSRNLEADSRMGRFREDLYFRLNVFTVQLPPLRDRIDDIPLLVDHFVARCAETMERSPVRVSPEVMRRLMGYGWPGNVRELENVIERGMILCEGMMTEACLPDALRYAAGVAEADEDLSIKRAEDAIERDLIRKALLKTGGNRTQAARILEISHRSLLYKLKEFGID